MSPQPQPPYVIEPFDSARHDRAGISCGVSAVDNFFKKTANKLAEAGNVRLFVMVSSDQALIGFYAINAHAVHYQVLPKRFARSRPGHSSIPAAFIAMIGRDQRSSMCSIAATPSARLGAKRCTRAMAFSPCHPTPPCSSYPSTPFAS